MKRFLLIFAMLMVLVPMAYLGYEVWHVVDEASSQIQRGAIDQVIASESPVFYADGQTPLGVFFDKTHSQYIPYRDIPAVFVKALVASEDRNFFDHWGFDLKAIVRAFVHNLRAGRVVQGGSTLTQQTAKNIFKREKRSYQAKVREIIQGILLERRYSKEEILEMYANQFFVTGYGKGLSIAAQYFFDKDPRELDLVEAAFIVGSVKGPNRYNPFIKKTEAEKQRALDLAHARKNYVLGAMLEQGYITRSVYEETRDTAVPFRQGRITYRLNVILNYVRNQLESEYFQKILEEQGVENIATSGIRITTSVEKHIQEAALEGLRRHLPVLDIKLRGYLPTISPEQDSEEMDRGLRKDTGTLPFMARVTHLEPEKGTLTVSWEGGGGVIDAAGMHSLAEAWIQGQQGSWVKLQKEHLPKFLKQIEPDSLVAVRMAPVPKEASEEGQTRRLILTTVPDVEGGVVVLQGGMIRAMAGGFHDRFFNRAADARRQLGSIFKPLVYAAALNLKWNILDTLPNRRDIYTFQRTSYVPRPDHEPEGESVSLAWACAKSENLATVWLLYHLTDHLNLREFRDLANMLGLGQREDEPHEVYRARIRDQHGVLVNRDALLQAAFDWAKGHIETDVIFSGHEDSLENLRRLHFRLPTPMPDLERTEADQILPYDYQRLSQAKREMRLQVQEINAIVSRSRTTDLSREPWVHERLTFLLRDFYRTLDGAGKARWIYAAHSRAIRSVGAVPVTAAWVLENALPPRVDKDIWIDNVAPAETLDLLEKAMGDRFQKLQAQPPYSMEVLQGVRDFRILLNIAYVVHLSKKLGISTELDPVLSFPLGPNAISIMEAALSYEGLATGWRYPLFPESGVRAVPIIKRITDREGEILYEYESKPERVLSERVSFLVSEILRKVMEYGTGRRARDEVQLFDIPVPTLGKTGTANRFTNSSFVGLVPGYSLEEKTLSVEKGYVIASYVGYDDNRPMKRRHVEIYGSSGALPIWIDTARAIVQSREYTEGLQPADMVFYTLSPPKSIEGVFRKITLSSKDGTPLPSSGRGTGGPSPEILVNVHQTRPGLQLERVFEP